MLIKKIESDLIAARKAKNSIDIKILSTLFAEAKMHGFNDGKRDSTDAEVLRTLKASIDAVSDCAKASNGGVPTLEQQHEMDLYMAYCPKQWTEEETRNAIKVIIKEIGATSKKDLGKVMAELKNQHAGKYAGEKAKDISLSELNSITSV